MACTIDLRCLDDGFGGKTYKRKRQSPTEDLCFMHVDPNHNPLPPSKRFALPSPNDPDKPSPTAFYAGKVSGRKWKLPRKHRTSAVRVTSAKQSYEESQREREVKKAYRKRKEGLKEEIRRNKEDKRKRREEMKKKKEENILEKTTVLTV